MKKYNKWLSCMGFWKKSLLFVFVAFAFDNAHSQLLVEGELLLKDKNNVNDAIIKIEKDGKIVETIDIKKNGVFSIEMEMNHNYILYFTEENYVTKRIELNTNTPADKNPKSLKPIYFEVELFPDVPESELGGFKFPVGKIKYDPQIEDFNYDLNYSRSIKNKVDNTEEKYAEAFEAYKKEQKEQELAELKKQQEDKRQEELKKKQEEIQQEKELAEKRKAEELKKQEEEKKRQEELRKKLAEEAEKRKAEEQAKEQARLIEEQKMKEQRESEAKRKADSIAQVREKEKAEKLAEIEKAAAEREKELEEKRKKEEEEREKLLKQIEEEAQKRKKEEELLAQQEKMKQEKLQQELKDQALKRKEKEEEERTLTKEEQQELIKKQKEEAKKEFLEEINSGKKQLLNRPEESNEDLTIPDQSKKVDNYNKHGMNITRIIINREDIIRIYHKVEHYWGGVFYFKNYRVISKQQFEIETEVE